MGFYTPEALVSDARRHGVPVLAPDVNHSAAVCTLVEEGSATAVRLGLGYVHGLGTVGPAHVVECRGAGPFRSLADFCRRTRLPKAVVENLVRAGALDSLGHKRRDMVWELGGLDYQEMALESPVEPVALPELGTAERVGWEYELLGLSPDEHVMAFYREALSARGVLAVTALANTPDGQRVRIAGRVLVRQSPPSAKGYVFITLEDETGLVNLIVKPGVYRQYREALRNAPLLVVEGCLQREGGALSVLVQSAIGYRTLMGTDFR
jgi:error-prone DNA polymerase